MATVASTDLLSSLVTDVGFGFRRRHRHLRRWWYMYRKWGSQIPRSAVATPWDRRQSADCRQIEAADRRQLMMMMMLMVVNPATRQWAALPM